jgi:hypothetical protein
MGIEQRLIGLYQASLFKQLKIVSMLQSQRMTNDNNGSLSAAYGGAIVGRDILISSYQCWQPEWYVSLVIKII